MEIQCQFDSHKFSSWLSEFEQRQVPFAVSVTLNDIAFNIQMRSQMAVSRSMILRNNWTKRGIIFNRSHKSQWPHCRAEVGSRDWYMDFQERGGIRRPKGKVIAIPGEIRQNQTKLIPFRDRPKNLLQRRSGKTKPFILKRGGKYIGIYKREGDGRFPLKNLYTFVKQQSPRPRPWLIRSAEIEVKKFPDLFQKRFKQAVEEAK